jgi:ribosomal protein S18 acetylase RimI-like enzyme
MFSTDSLAPSYTKTRWNASVAGFEGRLILPSTMEYHIRTILSNELPLLGDFLYEAIYQPAGSAPLPRDVIRRPEISLYLENFGRPGDRCLVAEVDGRVAGAVWVRLFPDERKGYGTIDSETPELSISLYPPYRHRGIGRALINAMLELLRTEGCRRVSLSVQKENVAARLYRSLGFDVVEEVGDEYIMACVLPPIMS